jgi:two-component system, cell cycle sensor histidine kinase and response regulator CckA
VTANPKPTILVVDDEKPVRELIRTILEGAGYPVLDARDGKEALQTFSLFSNKIDLLLTDVIMPSMNGKDLANRVSAIWPEVRVLFISAYAADVLSFHKLCPPGAEFIRKPFLKEELLTKVARILAVSYTWKELISKQG